MRPQASAPGPLPSGTTLPHTLWHIIEAASGHALQSITHGWQTETTKTCTSASDHLSGLRQRAFALDGKFGENCWVAANVKELQAKALHKRLQGPVRGYAHAVTRLPQPKRHRHKGLRCATHISTKLPEGCLGSAGLFVVTQPVLNWCIAGTVYHNHTGKL